MTEQQKTKKRKIPYLRLVIIFTVLIALVGIYAVCIYAPPLRISEETTRITGPLTADGQIDFFRYIEETTYPPEIATDENGARIFVRTFGEIASLSEFYKEQIYKKLGLDRSVPPTMVFPEEPQSLLLKLDLTGKLTQRIKKSWTLEDVPMLTEWIAGADAPLDAATEMVRKPVFFFPYLQEEKYYHSGNPQNLVSMPDNINTCRSIAKVYQARATYRIGTGNIDGAVDDVITIYQLGRKVGRGGDSLDMVLGVTIEIGANTIPIAENPNHQPTKEQLQRLLNAINQLPPPVLREKYLEFERVIGLSVVQDVFHTGNFNSIVEPTGDDSFESVINILTLSCDQNSVYKYVNEFYDKLITERIEWTDPSKFFSMIVENVPTSSGRGRLVGEIFRGLLTSALNVAEEAAHQMECVYNMKRLTLALLLYKTEHGEFPKEDWIEKVKPYLGDNMEQYLRCPSCATQNEGKTNYALVLYDSLPTDLDTLLLVELTEQVSYEHATINVDDVSTQTNVGSFHKDGMNVAVHNGAVMFFNVKENIEQFINKLIDPEVEE